MARMTSVIACERSASSEGYQSIMSVSFHPTPRRILVRGVNWLGDAVMTTPALMRLREKFPAAHITLLTHEKLRDVYLHHPALDETITFNMDEGLFALGRRLRSGKFDLALVLPNSPRSAMESWLARIPRRVGGTWPWRNWFLTDAIPPRSGAVKMSSELKAKFANSFRCPNRLSPLAPRLLPTTSINISILSPRSAQMARYCHRCWR